MSKTMLNCNLFSTFFSFLLLSGFGSCIRSFLLAKERAEIGKAIKENPGIPDLFWGDARDACKKINQEPTLKAAYKKIMSPINDVLPKDFEHLRLAVFIFVIGTDKLKIEVGQKLDPSIFEGRPDFKQFMEERLQHLLGIPKVNLSEPLDSKVVQGINEFKCGGGLLCKQILKHFEEKLTNFMEKLGQPTKT